MDRRTGIVKPGTDRRAGGTLVVVAANPLEQLGIRTLLEAASPQAAVVTCSRAAEVPLDDDIRMVIASATSEAEAEGCRALPSLFPDCPVVVLAQGGASHAELLASGVHRVVPLDEAADTLPRLVEGILESDRDIEARTGAPDPAQSPGESVLTTKIHRPGVPPDFVERSSLTGRLEVEKIRPLTLVTAPAGYGKTALIANWLQGCGWPAGWISLQEADGDLRIFLRYLIAAVQTVHPDAFRTTANLAATAPLPGTGRLAAALSTELEDIEEPFLLVLDDLHRVPADSRVYDLLDQLLLNPPIPLHLVIATRWDPPLSLRRLRASGQVFEVRARDLAFDDESTHTLIERVSGITVNESQLRRVQQTLEGWPVGLRLLGLALERSGDPAGLLEDLSTLDSSIQEYLVTELVDTQDESNRRRLLEISILDRFSAPLIAAVCSTGSGETGFLAEARTKGLPLVPLDAGNQWFRFHHTFQTVLQQLLGDRVDAAAIAALHVRASDWFMANDLIPEAIDHALRAEDVAKAADIVAQKFRQQLERINWLEVDDWLDRLPEEAVASRSELLIARGWTLRLGCHYEQAAEVIETLSAVPEDRLTRQMKRDLEALKGGICQPRCDYPGAVAHLGRALEGLGGQATGLDGADAMNLAYSLVLDRGAEAGEHYLEDVMSQVDAECRLFHSLANAGLMHIYLASGSHRRLRKLVRQMGERFPEGIGRDAYRLGCSFLYTWELERAAEQFDVAAANSGGVRGHALLDLYAGQALVNTYLQQFDKAEAALTALAELAEYYEDIGEAIVGSLNARLALLRGDTDAGRRWATSYARAADGIEQTIWTELPSLTQVRVLIETGDPGGVRLALERLEAARPILERVPVQVPELEILAAAAFFKLDDPKAASASLEAAVSRAASQGTVRPFAECLHLIRAPLKGLRVDDSSRSFLGKVLGLAGPGEREPEKAAGLMAGGEPLTNRELDILELLEQRLQNKVIAARLFVSPETVKTHLKHLYQKLGVQNRRQAAALAGELLAERRSPPVRSP